MTNHIVRDGKGIVYWTQTHAGTTKVYDSKNRLLGWCADGKTRDAKGILVALSESPGLLVMSSG